MTDTERELVVACVLLMVGSVFACIMSYFCGRYNQTRVHMVKLTEARLYAEREFYRNLVKAVEGIGKPPGWERYD